MAIIQRFNHNLVPYYRTNEPVKLSQFDKDMTILHFAIWNYQNRVDLTGMSASISGRKPDDTLFFYQCEIVSDPETPEGEHDYKVIQVNVKEQMSVVDGQGLAEITLSDGTNNVAHTANFSILIEKSPTDGYAVSETEISVFQDLLNQAEEIAGSLSGIDSRAETAAQNAAQSASSASASATLASNSAATANASATSASQSASSAETAKTAAQTAKTSAETAATNAANSASSAESIATDVASAVQRVEEIEQSVATTATNASAYATSANESATSASDNASSASISASTAESAATEAQQYAQASHQDYTNIYNGLSAEITERETADDAINQRIDNFVRLQQGSTTGDAELADIRVAYDGTEYPTAGDAVRAQAMRSESIAETFDATHAYAEGQYVWYNKTLYRFTRAHSASAWNGGDVIATSVGNGVLENTNAIRELISSGGGFSADAKLALLACFQKVAWIDDQGQTYYDALHHALFATAVSISATFNPGSHVFYETDTLNDLRPYLLVRATMPDSSVDIVTNYTLSGSMAVGTNTITVRYQGLTDTFEVTTQADPAYIEAVYTPSETVYSTDSLDILKNDLVVTYYSVPGATGMVLADSDYTLVGTLTEGTSIITVEYQGLIDTFNTTVVPLNAYLYKFDENILSSGAKDFGFTGSASYVTGIHGKAYRKESTNTGGLSVVGMANAPEFNGDFTISCWARAVDGNRILMLTNKCYYSSNRVQIDMNDVTFYNGATATYPSSGAGLFYGGISMLAENGKFIVRLFDAAFTKGFSFEITLANSHDYTQWHHYAMVRHNTTVSVFVDGVKILDVANFSGAIYAPNQYAVGVGFKESSTDPHGVSTNTTVIEIDELFVSNTKCLYTATFDPNNIRYT